MLSSAKQGLKRMAYSSTTSRSKPMQGHDDCMSLGAADDVHIGHVAEAQRD